MKPTIIFRALMVTAAVSLLASSAQATVVPSVIKGMSVFTGWSPGAGLAGAWESQYSNNGQPVGGTFNAVLTEGNGRLVNTSAGDVDGDGNTEVILSYNAGPVGHWMVDIDADGNEIGGTFTGLDSFGDGRWVDSAVADLGTGDGVADVLWAQSNISGADNGVWAFTTDSGGTLNNFRRILTLNNANLYSIGAGDIDNDGSAEILIGEHSGTVNSTLGFGTAIELFVYDTDTNGVVGAATSLGTFNPGGDGGYLGLAGGDPFNDSIDMVFGGYALSQWSSGGTAANVIAAETFNVAGGALTNQQNLNLDDFNRRTDLGFTTYANVPEPGTVGLLALGFATGMLVRRLSGRS